MREPSRNTVLVAGAIYGALTTANFVQNNSERDHWLLRVAGAATTDHVQDVFGVFGKQIKVDDKPGGSILDSEPVNHESIQVVSAPPSVGQMALWVEVER